jgi:hypothetical protein
MKPYYKLNISTVNAINPNWKRPDVNANPNQNMWYYGADDLCNRDWLYYMISLGIMVKDALVFYRKPGATQDYAHIDIDYGELFNNGNRPFTPYAFNWTEGGENSNMLWYHVPQDGIHMRYQPDGKPFIAWGVDELQFMTKTEIPHDTLTLVSTSLPHSIEMGDEGRWCFSVRTHIDIETWDEVVMDLFFKGLIQEQEYGDQVGSLGSN